MIVNDEFSMTQKIQHGHKVAGIAVDKKSTIFVLNITNSFFTKMPAFLVIECVKMYMCFVTAK